MGTATSILPAPQPRLDVLAGIVEGALGGVETRVRSLQFGTVGTFVSPPSRTYTARATVPVAIDGTANEMYIIALAPGDALTLARCRGAQPVAEIALGLGAAVGDYWINLITSVQYNAPPIRRTLGADAPSFARFVTEEAAEGLRVARAISLHDPAGTHRGQLVCPQFGLEAPVIQFIGILGLLREEDHAAVIDYTQAIARPEARTSRTFLTGLFD